MDEKGNQQLIDWDAPDKEPQYYSVVDDASKEKKIEVFKMPVQDFSITFKPAPGPMVSGMFEFPTETHDDAIDALKYGSPLKYGIDDLLGDDPNYMTARTLKEIVRAHLPVP